MPKEIVTLKEALARVGLEGLAGEFEADMLVEWTGTPHMFSCGHDAIAGFGPTCEDMGLDGGKKRIYQEKVRVCQALCSGLILFGWQRYSKSSAGATYAINSQAYVVIDTPPDEPHPVLKLAISA